MPNAHVDREVQTLLSVNPYFQDPSDPPERIRVWCHRGIQTETQLGIDDSYEQIEDSLRYTPYSHILSEAIAIQDIPKKTVLKFAENILLQDIDSFDENSTWDFCDLPQVLVTVCTRKGNLRHREEDMEEQMVNEECQTTLTVRPMFLELDDVANVMCNMQVQTSRTFTPDASMELVDKDLHTYYFHMNNAEAVIEVNSQRRITDVADPNSPISQIRSTKFSNNICRYFIEDIWNTCEECCEEIEESDPPKSARPQSIHFADHPICQYSSKDIEEICLKCCDESEVLEKIKSWYDEVEDIIREDVYEENIDPITGDNLDEIEAQMISGVNLTSDIVEAQALRMSLRYAETETKDFEIQCKEFADHRVPGECRGRRKDKSCTCDCQLYAKPAPNSSNGFNICAEKLAELCRMLTSGDFSNFFAEQLSGSGEASSDLATRRVKTNQSRKARACTNRKCNCLYSQGCLHCEKALEMERKFNPNNLSRFGKKTPMSQDIKFLWELDGEYAEAYIEGLDQDDAFTQTDFGTDCYFGSDDTPCVPPPPCSCLANVEMPWDMLLIPPTPKKRPDQEPECSEESADKPQKATKAENPVFDALPEMVLAQLRELTVRPITEEQLLALTKEFLEDNISRSEDIEEIQRQILAEKARVDAEMASMATVDESEAKGENEEETAFVHCRPRPPLKPFQVYNPDYEVHNEIYLDRVRRYFGDDDEMDAGPCSSHVEMPWNEIALAKTIVIRKGRHPCQRLTKKSAKDPNRKCGPLYREQMRQQPLNDHDLCGIELCPMRISQKGFSDTNIKKHIDKCICNSCGSTSQPDLSSNATCICPPKETLVKKDGIISCLKRNNEKEKNMSAPAIMKKSTSYVCSSGKKSTGNSPNIAVSMGKPPQTRTERIAALLESCKREMEPIKDGINQLRSRIKELNIPDLINYQDPMQHPALAGSGGLSFMSGAMPPMPPMCYPPPIMCYPFPPCMYPPSASANAQVSRLPPEMSKDSYASKRPARSRRRRPPSSSCNTTTDTNTVSSEYEQHLTQKRRVMRKSSQSRSRLICSCKPQYSTADASPSGCKTTVSSAGVSMKSSRGTQEKSTSVGKCARNKSIICACKPSSSCFKSVTSSRSDGRSMIPRRVDCACNKTLTVGTQKTYQSCASNLSSNTVNSCRSRANQKESSTSPISNENSNGKVECSDTCKRSSTKQKEEVGKYSSDEVMMVKSCATQNSTPDMPIEKTKTSAAAVSCKIRFEEKPKKCCKCCKSRGKTSEGRVEVSPSKIENGE